MSTQVEKDGTEVLSMKLFYLHPKRNFGLTWSYFLYVSILELLIFATLLIFNLLGKSPTLDYYWAILLHVPHLFSWAGVYACLSKNFNYSFYRAVMVLYGFSFLFDLGASLWKILATEWYCGTPCDNYTFGVLGYSFALFYVVWDVVVFVSLVFIVRRLLAFVQEQNIKTNAILNTPKTNNLKDTDYDDQMFKQYEKLAKEPPATSLFTRRFVLIVAIVFEPLLFFGLLIIIMLGLVVSEFFMWTILFQILHGFSWIFLASCVYNNYSKTFFRATMVLCVFNFLLDLASLIIRIVLIATCDTTTNVDCVFRNFPGIIPIILLTFFMWIIDIYAIITLSRYYAWVLELIWIPAAEMEKQITKMAREIRKKKKEEDENNQRLVEQPQQSKRRMEDESEIRHRQSQKSFHN